MPHTLLPALAAAAAVLAAARATRRPRSPVGALLTSGAHRGRGGLPRPARRSFVAGLGRLGPIRGMGASDQLRQRAVLAGWSDRMEELVGRKALLGALGLLSAAVFASRSPAAVLLAPALAAAAFRAPDFLLARLARRRQGEINRHVADLVEVLVATTDAGLSPPVALRRAVGVTRGPLGEELLTSVREIELGMPWRQSLVRLLDRTDAPAIGRLVTTLIRSQRLGASISSSLRALAEDVRGERRAEAEEAARRAPVKMLFPLVFLVLPAFLLLTVGPALLSTLRSLH